MSWNPYYTGQISTQHALKPPKRLFFRLNLWPWSLLKKFLPLSYIIRQSPEPTLPTPTDLCDCLTNLKLYFSTYNGWFQQKTYLQCTTNTGQHSYATKLPWTEHAVLIIRALQYCYALDCSFLKALQVYITVVIHSWLMGTQLLSEIMMTSIWDLSKKL